MALALVPISLREAHAFVERHHRHHNPSRGGKFAIGCERGGVVVGVVVVGRPVARASDNGYTAEVNRLATDGSMNVCSMLYQAAWRAARAMGYKRLVTYTLKSEGGGSLRAAGWKVIGEVKGRSWDCPIRPRVDTHPLQDKFCWEAQ